MTQRSRRSRRSEGKEQPHRLQRRRSRSRQRHRSRPPQGFSFIDHFGQLAAAAAIAFVLGGMPVLWNLMPHVAPIIFTAIGSLSLVALVAFKRAWQLPDRRVLIAVAVYLGLYIAFTYLSYAFSGVKISERWSLLQTNSMVLTMGLFYFLGGGVLSRDKRWGVTAGLIAAYVIVAVYALAYRDVLTSADLMGRLRREGESYDYQQVGDSFALVSLALIARWHLTHRRVSWRGWASVVAFVAFSVMVLFIVPSRSAAFLGSSCLLLALVMRARGYWRIGMGVAVIIAGVFVAMQPVSELAEGSRFESILQDADEDLSVQGREEILEQGMKVISEHPFVGMFGFELERMGRSGLYIHNALDIWAQAGILPFTAFLVMWGLLAWRLFTTWRLSPRRMAAVVPLFAFALLSWVISRNAAYVLPMIGVGVFAAQVSYVRRREVQVKPRPSRHRRSRRGAARSSGVSSPSPTAAAG